MMQNPTSQTSFKPDYGAHLRRSGYSGTPIDFRDVPTDHITFLDEATMSITGSTVSDGAAYAVTFYVPMRLFEEFFANAPASVIHMLNSGLEGAHDFPVTVVLPEPFSVSMRTRLGEAVAGAYEEFVPSVVTEVLPSPDHTRLMCLSSPRGDGCQVEPVMVMTLPLAHGTM